MSEEPTNLEEVQYEPDPLDGTGGRCGVVHPFGLTCHRRFDHEAQGDPWHRAMSDYDHDSRRGRYWRWTT